MSEGISPPSSVFKQAENHDVEDLLSRLLKHSDLTSSEAPMTPASVPQPEKKIDENSGPAEPAIDHEAERIIEEALPPPRSPEATATLDQKRTEVRVQETSSLARKILREKTNTYKTSPDTEWQQHAGKYATLCELEDYADGPTPYDTYDDMPLHKFGKVPWVRKNENGEYVPSSLTDPHAVAIYAVKEKHGSLYTCVDKDGNSHILSLNTLLDAQMALIADIDRDGLDKLNGVFTEEEFTIMNAANDALQKNDLTRVNTLFDDMKDIRAFAEKYGLLTTDAVRAYLNTLYQELQPKPGQELTPEEKLHNQLLQVRKQEVIDALDLDTRSFADENVMVGLTTKTFKDTVDTLKNARDSSADPRERQELENAIREIEGRGSELPKLMSEVMRDKMTPELATEINGLLSRGDGAAMWAKVIEMYPEEQEEVDKLKSRFGNEAMKAGGFALLILAIIGGAMAMRGMSEQR